MKNARVTATDGNAARALTARIFANRASPVTPTSATLNSRWTASRQKVQMEMGLQVSPMLRKQLLKV